MRHDDDISASQHGPSPFLSIDRGTQGSLEQDWREQASSGVITWEQLDRLRELARSYGRRRPLAIVSPAKWAAECRMRLGRKLLAAIEREIPKLRAEWVAGIPDDPLRDFLVGR